MKKTKVDKLGRIVLPIEFRRSLGLRSGDEIEIKLEGNEIKITAASGYCPLCNKIKEWDKSLCHECMGRVLDENKNAQQVRSILWQKNEGEGKYK